MFSYERLLKKKKNIFFEENVGGVVELIPKYLTLYD